MIIFDELAYSKRLLDEGYIRKDKIRKDLFILYKYYKYLGYSKLQTAKCLFRFIKKHNDYVFKELEEKLKISIINGIEKVWKYNYTFRTGLEIKLSKNELDIVKTQKTNGEKQVLFAMIVLSKVFKTNTNVFYASMKDICGLTGLFYDKEHIKNIIYKLADNKHITIIKKKRATKTHEGNLIYYQEIHYMCNITECNDLIYIINNLSNNENLIKEFSNAMRVVDRDFKYCEICGEEFINVANYYKYCKNCSIKVNRARKRKTWHKYKNKYKTRQDGKS